MKELNPVSGEAAYLWRKEGESSQNAGSTQLKLYNFIKLLIIKQVVKQGSKEVSNLSVQTYLFKFKTS